MKSKIGSRCAEIEHIYVVKTAQDEYMCNVFRTYKAAKALASSNSTVEVWPMDQWKLDDKEIDPDKAVLKQLVDMEQLGGKMTASEMSRAAEVFGKTDDVQKCGWIMPDGSMLHFEYNTLKLTGKSHAQIYSILDEFHKSALRQMYNLDDSKLSSMNDSPAVDFCVQSGMIRCHVSSSHVYIQLEDKPTAAQKYVLLDIADFVKKNEGSKLNADIQCNGKFFQYCDRDLFSLRAVNDIFNAFHQ